MGVATARLVQDINIRQLIQDLASEWHDDESIVLELVAKEFEKDYLKRPEEGVHFFYTHRWEATNSTGSVSCHPVRLPVSGEGQRIAKGFRKIIRDPSGWEGKEVFVYVRAYEIREKCGANSSSYLQLKKLFHSSPGDLFKIPLRKISVDKDDVIQLLSDKSLLVPNAWMGTGLIQAARSKGGSQRKYDSGLQEAIYRIRDILNNEGKKLTPSTLNEWFEENALYEDRYSFDPPIPTCDELYLEGDELNWVDDDGRGQHRSLRSLERYIRRAKENKKV